MTNAIPFPPQLKPSSRSYKAGSYPSTDFQSLDGTKTHIRFGNKPIGATLTLGFSNITDDHAALILGNYYDVNSDWDHVTFKSGGVIAGLEDTDATDKTLTRQLTEQNELYGGKWRYAAPPTVTSTFNGRSNVSCSFVACLDSPSA
jgi:hypothetical protein